MCIETYISAVSKGFGFHHRDPAAVRIGLRLLHTGIELLNRNLPAQDILGSSYFEHLSEVSEVYKNLSDGNIPREKALQRLRNLQQEYTAHCVRHYAVQEEHLTTHKTHFY